jgi:type IV fimbrial biogenesis protein FimT
MKTCRHLRGITLVEALVVMAIATITVSAAAPSFAGFIERQRLGGVSAQLVTDLQFARTEAVLRNQPVRWSLYPLPSGGTCYLLHTGNPTQCHCLSTGPATCTGDAMPLKTVQWTAADLIRLDANVRSIAFDPLHGTSSPTGSLRVTDSSGHTIQHVVNIMGRVRSCGLRGPMAGHPAC